MLIFNNDSFSRTAKCILWNGASAVDSEGSASVLDFGLTVYPLASFESTMTLMSPLTLAAPGTVTVQCAVLPGGSGPGVVGVNRIKLIAVQVGSLIVQ
jgi:hypothetical protein